MLEYKYNKRDNKFTENGHTMFEVDVLKRLKRLAYLEEQITKKVEPIQLNIPIVNKSYFHSVIKKLPHSEGRVPYTYHHDYLRMNVDKFTDSSRSEVASNNSENETELYAVALTQLLSELNFKDTINLNNDDIIACKKAIEITDNIVSRYNCV